MTPAAWVNSPIRRLLDLAVAVPAFIVALPVLAVACVAVRLVSGPPTFFLQSRVGRGGSSFTMLKLRTMSLDTEGASPKVTSADDPRIDPLGRLFRATKLDELPQLLNVIRGDMALVGPRPEVPDMVEASPESYAPLLLARPGLTDPTVLDMRDEERLLAGREDVEAHYLEHMVPEKNRRSLDYLAHATWYRDLAVMGRTALALLAVRLR